MPETTIDHLLQQRGRPLLSFEFFPPKRPEGLALLLRAAEQMRAAGPDFVSVTYGAGGSTRGSSLDLCQRLRDMGLGLVMPHLTCVGATAAELRTLVREIRGAGFLNIMALRGDPPAADTAFAVPPGGLRYASELVTLIRDEHPSLCCGVAGYPETHPESPSPDLGLLHLKMKLAAGASFVTTQLFFDNRVYYAFVERCRRLGIYHPIVPGILPAVSLDQARRLAAMCHATLPPQLEVDLEDARNNPEAMAAIGIQWAARQVDDLLQNGAPGIHLYVLNRMQTALAPVMTRCFEKYR